MSAENFDPTRLRGVSVNTVFDDEANTIRFSPSSKRSFFTLEQTHASPEGEPILLYEMATAVTEGASLRNIAGRYGLSHRLVGRLLQAANIPYATREQAVQRLWEDSQFREKNGSAMLAGRDASWKDPKKREVTISKLRKSTIRQMADPELRKRLAESSSRTSKERWQDPEYRAKMAEHGFPIGRLMSNPEVVARMSETRRRQWEDPEFRERNLEISRRNLAEIKQRPSYRQKRSELQKKRWEKDPEYRRRMAESASRNLTQLWQDPEYRAAAIERSREIMTRLSSDPEFRARGIEVRREHMADPVYRDQISEIRRQIALSLWEDPDYRAKLVDVHKALWQDPEYRENQGAALLAARLNPANRDRMVLPTIHGFRADIGFYAQSAWEANVARVLTLVGREYAVGINLRLKVTEDFQELFQASETTFNVDFSTLNRRGKTVIYELMAHPLEDPDGWAKLEMARRQNPDLVIRAIDENTYDRLQSRFQGAINTDPRFRGWEKTGFNLRTHPEIFGLNL